MTLLLKRGEGRKLRRDETVNSANSFLGAIEGGGTKFLCAVGTGTQDIIDQVEIPTRYPEETIRDIAAFFSAYKGRLDVVGVGCFGPIDLAKGSSNYGRLYEGQKPGWSGFDLYQALSQAVSAPIILDTDVNAAALGEATLGAAHDVEHSIYITIGTGIGAGVISGGRIVYGQYHTEIGCMLLPKDPRDAEFSGVCRFHGDQCVEGLASGPAIKARWGASGDELPNDHPAWDLEAGYIAMLCNNLIMAYAPQRIILGGGVMKQAHLFPLIRDKLKHLDKWYIGQPDKASAREDLIRPPALKGVSGLLGAMVMAEQEYARQISKGSV